MKAPKYPRAPRTLCSSWLHFVLGIRSPSKTLTLVVNGPRNKAEAQYREKVKAYYAEMDRYKIFTRTMTKDDWRDYHRAERRKKKTMNLEE